MSEELTATPRHLKACEVLDIRDGQGLRVKSLRGVLWITQSNDSEDIVVRDGQTFVLDRPGRGHMRKHISFTATAAFPGLLLRSMGSVNVQGRLAPSPFCGIVPKQEQF
jgi:hypothetical protein